jgi:ketosteroid isomerase-like protein
VSELVMTPERVVRGGDEVTESGTVTLRFRGQGGETRRERGTYEHLWARQGDGTWKLRLVRMETHPAPG